MHEQSSGPGVNSVDGWLMRMIWPGEELFEATKCPTDRRYGVWRRGRDI